jgi:hypothetical protein
MPLTNDPRFSSISLRVTAKATPPPSEEPKEMNLSGSPLNLEAFEWHYRELALPQQGKTTSVDSTVSKY